MGSDRPRRRIRQQTIPTTTTGRSITSSIGSAGLSVPLVSVLLHAGGCGLFDSRGLPQGGSVVIFPRAVAPLVFERCSSCPRPGQLVPFALLHNVDVRKRAGQIATDTRT